MSQIPEAQWTELDAAARRASTNAWSPYSTFRVGAAVLTEDGAIAAGCNVENASYGLTVCAERNAVCRAVADGARTLVALVVHTPTAAPVTPCGACLQVIAEFGRNVEIRCTCDGPDVAVFGIAELLPHAFAFNLRQGPAA